MELSKDIQERSDLLCKASKALELLEEQKSQEMKHTEMVVEEMSQKIESLEHEVASLQSALEDAKSSLGNDTGYADFLGAVDTKDVEHQRKLIEKDEINEKLERELNKMKEKLKELQRSKKDIDSKTSVLLYENDEMKDKMSEVEKKMNEQVMIEFLFSYLYLLMIPSQLKKFKLLNEICNRKSIDQEFLQVENENFHYNLLNVKFISWILSLCCQSSFRIL